MAPQESRLANEAPVLSLMYNNAATRQRRGRTRTICGVHLIIVNDLTSGLVPNLHAKLVYAATAASFSIDGCQHESVVSNPVNSTESFVLSFCAGDHQPLICRAVEIQ